VRCETSGAARVSVLVSRATARKLGLRSRRLGARALACTAGADVTVRVPLSRAARKRLAGRRAALRVSLRLASDGAATVERTVRLR
jgi:hypothetical protein